MAGKSADATTEDEDAPELQMFTANEAILADIQANIRQNYEDVYDENIFSKVWKNIIIDYYIFVCNHKTFIYT